MNIRDLVGSLTGRSGPSVHIWFFAVWHVATMVITLLGLQGGTALLVEETIGLFGLLAWWLRVGRFEYARIDEHSNDPESDDDDRLRGAR